MHDYASLLEEEQARRPGQIAPSTRREADPRFRAAVRLAAAGTSAPEIQTQMWAAHIVPGTSNAQYLPSPSFAARAVERAQTLGERIARERSKLDAVGHTAHSRAAAAGQDARIVKRLAVRHQSPWQIAVGVQANAPERHRTAPIEEVGRVVDTTRRAWAEVAHGYTVGEWLQLDRRRELLAEVTTRVVNSGTLSPAEARLGRNALANGLPIDEQTFSPVVAEARQRWETHCRGLGLSDHDPRVDLGVATDLAKAGYSVQQVAAGLVTHHRSHRDASLSPGAAEVLAEAGERRAFRTLGAERSHVR